MDEKIDYNKQSEREDQRRENMNIKIISVGKLKEKYLIQGINEYVKRLN
ncbi:23S rRNA (pseudouridine(1915)-N(3))-methyltransferase RlmH, partial [Enterococcus faecium]|nr:23S rRNA (pseudouridine(1915)-N(3))-methyltransferase RlmH [Enterococcus faecium]